MRGAQQPKEVVLGEGKVAKHSVEDGNCKRGSRASLEDSAGSLKENLKRHPNGKAKQGVSNQ